MHERSKKGGGGIVEIACIAGTGEGKNFEDASAHEGKKLHSTRKLTDTSYAGYCKEQTLASCMSS